MKETALGERVVVPRGFDLSGLDGCRRHPVAQLFRYGMNVANVENDFRILCVFKELRVAKIAHISTFALCA